MKILYIIHIYNEMDFLPAKVKWCRENGLGMYILDNFSNDGSWEYLQENEIPCERVNTNGTFHLTLLQKATNNAIHRINPDWVCYTGMDTFVCTPTTLGEQISKCRGDILRGPWINIFNTGEVRGNPFKTYFYYSQIRTPIGLIYRYIPKSHLIADEVAWKGAKIVPLDGVYVNFGNVKPAKQRDDTLNRRKKAWTKGLPRSWGTHYPVYKKVNWLWEKNKLKDVRTSPYWNLYKKLWSL